MKIPSYVRTLAVLLIAAMPAAAKAPPKIDWAPYNSATFEQARAAHKLVFLDLGAVWCHWCHVMDQTTLSDPDVLATLERDFINVRVDQDARPDLSRKYEEYGWPALIVLDPVSMKDCTIATGYQTQQEFLNFLEHAKHPEENSTENSAETQPGGTGLSDRQRANLLNKLNDLYDLKAKGWGHGHKLVPWENIEYCLWLARDGNRQSRGMAMETLDAGRELIDPVWGGIYQYSTDGDWSHQHFEKIMEYQAEILRSYTMAYLQWHRPSDLVSAKAIAGYMNHFLRSAGGAYYVSQDADVIQGKHSADYFAKTDSARRAVGMPRIDQHIYTRENGLAISAMTLLWQATGNPEDLEHAVTAADQMLKTRSLANGGFSHGQDDLAGPYLTDQIQMLRGMLALYEATEDPRWKNQATACGDYICKNFKRPDADGAGYSTGIAQPGLPLPIANVDENIAAARSFNLLARITGFERFTTSAAQAMKFLCRDKIVKDIDQYPGGLLLADRELREEPEHLAIVGNRNDLTATALFREAQKDPASYKIIDWIAPQDAEKSGLPNLDQAAAFRCTSKRCSTPKFTAAELAKLFAPAG
jgi:uncharacterized protein YyaL (SSP411 family)